MSTEQSQHDPLQDKPESEKITDASSDAAIPPEDEIETEAVEINGGKSVRLKRIKRNTYYHGNKKK